MHPLDTKQKHCAKCWKGKTKKIYISVCPEGELHLEEIADEGYFEKYRKKAQKCEHYEGGE